MSGESILVVDDSKQIVEHLTDRILPTFGYKTMYAYDGQSGLQMIRDKKPDLVMLDYNLPEMTGLDVLQTMAQESLNTPVVLMTGYGSEQSAIEAFRLGAKDYLIKPFTIDEIVETIDRALVEKRLQHDKEQLAEQLRRVKVEISRQNHEMNTFFNIGKAITSLLSVGKVLERVLEASTYLTNAEVSTIWLPHDHSGGFQAYESRDKAVEGEPKPHLVMDNHLVGQVMEQGRPLRQSVFSGKGIPISSNTFVRALLYVPLKLRGVSMGVLGVSNEMAHRSFSQRDEFLLSFLADYAAISLENARVFQAADQALAARVEELNTLIEVTRTITSSLDLTEVLSQTIEQVHNSWNIQASSIWLLDEKREVLKVLSHVGTRDDDILAQIEIPLGKGFVGYVAKTGRRIYTNDVVNHPLHFRGVDEKTGFATHSLLCVPLVAQGKVIGALQLLNKANADFDDQDVEKAMSIATAVAIAVTNALLFNESESRKQHLEATLEHNNNPILITDAENKLHILNRQARLRLGLSPEAIGRPVTESLQQQELTAILSEPIAEKRSSEPSQRVILPDGSVWLPRVAPIPNHGRILILQDITSLQEVEEAKDLFLATVSHDMRAPLNSIQGYASALSDIGPLNQPQQEYVERIVSSTDRMKNLVNRLMELAKVNARVAQNHQECNIGEIVTDVVAELTGEALSSEVELQLTAVPEQLLVMGDAIQLRSAVVNLIDNAIKYSPQKAQVQIEVSGNHETVLIKVQDHGIGISAADLPRIFEMFYRAGNDSNSLGGVGLGLALVQSVAKAHSGEVWAESDNRTGSTFCLRLPLATTPAHEAG